MESRDQQVLLAFSSRKLDAASMSALDSHLEDCLACRQFVQAQGAVWDALDVWEAAPVSADFNRRLYQRLDRPVSWFDRVSGPLQWFGLRRLVPLAASAGVVFMAGLLFQHTAAVPAAPHDTAQMEALQPEQLESALDEMEALSQLSRPVHAETIDSKM
jgi:hypothetical protein